MGYLPNGFKPMEGLWNRVVEYFSADFPLTGVALGQQGQDNPNVWELPLVQLVEKARQEWEQAQALFNEAEDPGLVDHAIYAMIAAERKYIYLLKKAQKERVIDNDLYCGQENELA